MTDQPDRKVSNWVSGLLVGALLVAAIAMGFLESKTELDGSSAPAYSFPRFSGGGSVTSAALKGKVVLLDFWATWCPPCVEEMPWLVKVAKEYETKGVVFVAVSHDDGPHAIDDVTDFVRRAPDLGPFVVWGDPASAARYKVHALPTIFVLDRHGKISDSQTGQVSERAVRQWLDEALK